MWNAANSVLDVSFLVLAWNHHRYGKLLRQNRRRQHSRDNYLRHAQFAQKRQTGTKTVKETRQQRQIFRQKHDSMRLESFKTGEPQQVSDIGSGKPVLLGARHLHPNPLSKSNERFPEVVVSCYQHARVPLAKWP